jgi:hypothetical protein
MTHSCRLIAVMVAESATNNAFSVCGNETFLQLYSEAPSDGGHISTLQNIYTYIYTNWTKYICVCVSMTGAERAVHLREGGWVGFHPLLLLLEARRESDASSSTSSLVFYTWVARSRSGSSSFTASALNKPSSSSSSSSSSSEGSK